MSVRRYSVQDVSSRNEPGRRGENLVAKLNAFLLTAILAMFMFGAKQVADRLDKISDQLAEQRAAQSSLTARVQRNEADIVVIERRLGRNQN